MVSDERMPMASLPLIGTRATNNATCPIWRGMTLLSGSEVTVVTPRLLSLLRPILLLLGPGLASAFVLTVSACAAMMMGKTETACELIRAVRAGQAAKGKAILPNVRAVEACLKNRSAEVCQPDHTISTAH